MRFKNKLKLPIVLISVAVIAQAGIAFSAWVIINNGGNIESKIEGEIGEVQIGIPGIELTSTSDLLVGKYFYYVNGYSSPSADLTYTFSITPSLLPGVMKNDNGSGGFKFTLECDLTFESTAIFNPDDTYLTAVKLNDTLVPSLGYNGEDLIFYLNFSTNGQAEEVETFNLSFTFSNSLILDHRDKIQNGTFLLEISRKQI